MADKLDLYNGALRKLKEPRLVDLTENIKGRRVLDQCYDDVLAECIEAGFWNHALRSAKLDYNSSYAPEFGYDKIYDVPDDWVRTYSFCSDEYFSCPILNYQSIGSRWLCDYSEIYVQWVSDGELYGGDLGRWPRSYAKFVEYTLAFEACEEITGSGSRMEVLMGLKKRAEHDAKNTDAMNDPVTRFPPTGNWVRSRHAGRGIRGEGRYRAG